jgi:hypothetical protein
VVSGAAAAVAAATAPRGTAAAAHVMAMSVTSEAPAGAAVAATTTAQRGAPAAPQSSFGLPPYEYKGVYLNLAAPDAISGMPTTLVGAGAGCQLQTEGGGAAATHARIEQAAQGEFWLQDLGEPSGTWVNGLRLERGARRMLHAGDVLEFGGHPGEEVFRVKLQHPSYRTMEVAGHCYSTVNTGAMMSVP